MAPWYYACCHTDIPQGYGESLMLLFTPLFFLLWRQKCAVATHVSNVTLLFFLMFMQFLSKLQKTLSIPTFLTPKTICAIELVCPHISHLFSRTVMCSDNLKSFFFLLSLPHHIHTVSLAFILSLSHSLQTLKRTYCMHRERGSVNINYIHGNLAPASHIWVRAQCTQSFLSLLVLQSQYFFCSILVCWQQRLPCGKLTMQTWWQMVSANGLTSYYTTEIVNFVGLN